MLKSSVMRETSRLRHSGQKVASGGKCTAALGGSMILPHMLQRVMLVSLSDMASLSCRVQVKRRAARKPPLVVFPRTGYWKLPYWSAYEV